MIHPHVELRFINESIGYGVFATQDMPKGTIVYVKDSLEIVISPQDYNKYERVMQDVIEKYSYIDDTGSRIVSWDFAKYVNHCCQCNTMSTGYGFEIAIRDIIAGEQITDEYGLFNLEYEMDVYCGLPNCRKKIQPKDLSSNYITWDNQIKEALKNLKSVKQPLFHLLDSSTVDRINSFLTDDSQYVSITSLAYKNGKSALSLELATNGISHE